MARHILSVTSCERSRYNRVDNTHINPAKNSMYCVYIRHCQNEKGRVEVPRLSGLTVGRYFKQMKSNASYQLGHFLCIMHDISTRTCATIMKSDVSPIPMDMGSIPIYERTQLPMLWKLHRPPGRFLAGIISYILSRIVTSQVPQDFVQLHEALVDYVSWVISHHSTLKSLRSFLGLADSTISH